MLRWIPVVCLLGCPSDNPTEDLGFDLEANDYRMQVGGLTITDADPGLNTLVQLFFGQEVLFRFRNVSGGTADMEMVLGYPDTTPIERNPCWGLVTVNGVNVGDRITFGPEDLSFPREDGSTLSISQLSIDADLAEDGETVNDIVMSATLDARIVGADFGDPADLCDTFAGFGKPCGACADGEMFCADIEVTGLGATTADVLDFDDATQDAGECDS